MSGNVYALIVFKKVARAHNDALPAHHAGHPVRGDEVHLGVLKVAPATPARRVHDGHGHGMKVVLFQRGGEVNHVFRPEVAAESERIGHAHAPRRQRAGFVKDEGDHLGEFFQRIGALEQQPALARRIHAGFEGHGRGELQGTSVVGLQHSGSAPPVAREQPRRRAQRQHAGHQAVSEAVGRQLRGAFHLQRAVHIVGNARSCRARTHVLGIHAQRAFLHHSAREHAMPAHAAHGHALARHAGFVDAGLAAQHRAIDGNGAAGAADDDIAHAHLGGGNLLLLPLALHPDAACVRAQQPFEHVIGAAHDGVLHVLAQRQQKKCGVGGKPVAAGG